MPSPCIILYISPSGGLNDCQDDYERKYKPCCGETEIDLNVNRRTLGNYCKSTID